MTSTNAPASSKLPPHRVLAEPLLRFGPGAAASVSPHPLRGLLTHGPYSRGTFGNSSVRIAMVTTKPLLQRLKAFLGSLRQEFEPSDRKKYVPTYPGFQQVLGVDLVPARDDAIIALDEVGTGTADPHKAACDAVTAAVRQLHTVRLYLGRDRRAAADKLAVFQGIGGRELRSSRPAEGQFGPR